MDHGDFDSISWSNPTGDESSRPTTAGTNGGEDGDGHGKQRIDHPNSPQAGKNADTMDLAGIGEGRLDCVVDSPQKENEGTKDAFMSYKVTTHVSARSSDFLSNIEL